MAFHPYHSRRRRSSFRRELWGGERLGCELLESRRLLATFEVNVELDLPDATPLGDGVIDVDPELAGEQVSLRAAIAEANALIGDDLIQLPPGDFVLTSLDSPAGARGGSLIVTDTSGLVTVRGAGLDQSRISIASDNSIEDRVFDVKQGARLHLFSLSLFGGRAIENESTDGGAIRNFGELSVTDVQIGDSQAIGLGGAIANLGGRVTVDNSRLVGNLAEAGGAIANFGGTVVIRDTMLDDNSAGNGGALWNTGQLDVLRSTIANNVATRTLVSGEFAEAEGGGIWNSGELLVTTSTLSGNRAADNGGGIYTGRAASTTISRSTITQNVAADTEVSAGSGGGLSHDNAGQVLLVYTLIAENQAGQVPPRPDDVAGSVDDTSSFNLIGVDAGLTGIRDGEQGNLIGSVLAPVQPLLGPLQDNGGPTWTHELLAGSPAIDRGAPGDGQFPDQRGHFRPTDGDADGVPVIDVGAYEFELQLVVVNTNDEGPGSLRRAIEHANFAAGSQIITFAIPTTDPGFERVDDTVASQAFLIRPASPLPPLDDFQGGTTIDGFSQTVFSGDTNPLGPEIVLSGARLTTSVAAGLQLNSAGNTVQGLNVQQFDQAAALRVLGSDNRIVGNFIGTNASGSGPAGNLLGVLLLGDQNQVGSLAATDLNLIGFNAGPGIAVQQTGDLSPVGNTLRGNSFLANQGPDIDLGFDGITPNDPSDADAGPNQRLNFPIIDRVVGGQRTWLAGHFAGQPLATLVLDFYRLDTTNANSGQQHLGSHQIVTDQDGQASFEVSYPRPSAFGTLLTATATDEAGNTSEFSAPQAAQLAGLVRGLAYDDHSANGAYEPAEDAPLANLALELLSDVDQDGTFELDQTAHTSATGEYEFSQLAPGTYTIRAFTPAGYFSTTTDLVSIQVATDTQHVATPAQVDPDGLDLVVIDQRLAFGKTRPGTITGQVWLDRRGDQITTDDLPQGSVEIQLLQDNGNGSFDPNDTRVAVTATLESGQFEFGGLRPGVYFVRQTVPLGFVQTVGGPGQESTYTQLLTSNQQASGVDFANAQLARIRGQLRDGDGHEQLVGWTVELRNASGLTVATTQTDLQGNYEFANLSPGAYTVAEQLLPGWEQTAPLRRFATTTAITGGIIVQSITPADLNQDGLMDLIVANDTDASVSQSASLDLVPNLGEGQFGQPLRVSLPAGVRPGAILVADLNRDGLSDVVVANIGRPTGASAASSLLILAGARDFGFAEPLVIPAGDGPLALAAADLNADGWLDLLAANFRGNDVSVLLATGPLQYSLQRSVPVGDQPGALLTRDVDRNGTVDLVVANLRSHEIQLFSGMGDGTFRWRGQLPAAAGPTDLVMHDWDEDGWLDLAVAIRSSDQIQIFRGTGEFQFESAAVLNAGGRPQSLAVGDLNQDGTADLAVANSGSASFTTWFNGGDFSFERPQEYAILTQSSNAASPQSIAAVDLDGDQLLDLAIGNYALGGHVMLNRLGTYFVELTYEDVADGRDFVHLRIGSTALQRSSSLLDGNSVHPLDVNRDGQLSALDALLVINHLNQADAGRTARESLGLLDTNGDGIITALDVLLIINSLNSSAPPLRSISTMNYSAADVASSIDPMVRRKEVAAIMGSQ